VQRRARTMFELTILQGALGYTQYFLHDAAAIVELHLAGVTCLWIAASGLLLSLHEHVVPERTPAQKPTGADAAATPATTIAAVGTERPAAEPAPLR